MHRVKPKLIEQPDLMQVKLVLCIANKLDVAKEIDAR